MQAVEKMLDDAFKKVPSLPEDARKGLATAMPWLALASGILSLVAAWYLYQSLMVLDTVTLGYVARTSSITFVAWMSLAILVAQAVLSFVAFPALRANKKSGWNLMLWMLFATVLYAVVYNLFSGYFGFNLGGLLFSLLVSAIGLYLLFQVRPAFMGGEATTTATPAAKPTEPTPPKTNKKA